MITTDDLAAALAGENIQQVSRDTGIHYNTIYRIRNGKAHNLTLDTYNTLAAYLESKIEKL